MHWGAGRGVEGMQMNWGAEHIMMGSTSGVFVHTVSVYSMHSRGTLEFAAHVEG